MMEAGDQAATFIFLSMMLLLFFGVYKVYNPPKNPYLPEPKPSRKEPKLRLYPIVCEQHIGELRPGKFALLDHKRCDFCKKGVANK